MEGINKKQHYLKQLSENNARLDHLLTKVSRFRSVIDIAESEIMKALQREKKIKKQLNLLIGEKIN